jgi:hypothetical protein
MTFRTARAHAFLLVLALVSSAEPLRAAPEAPSKEAAVTQKARAALPAPSETNGLSYAGELWVDGVWAGSVKLSAEAGEFADKPAWLVTEDVFWDFGGTDWRLGATYTLGRDLALLRAEVELRAKGAVTRWDVARSDKGLEGQKQVIQGEVEGGFEPFAWTSPSGTSAGYAALALFLRGPLPAGEKAFELAWVDPGAWARGATPVVPALRLEPVGEKTFDAVTGKPETLETRATGTTLAGNVHVGRKDRALVGWSGLLHEKAVVVPPGKQPDGAKFDEKAPARTWKDAFLKFGIGYHMAREDILAASFHWDTMYEYETSLVDGWPKEKPVAEFRKAWLEAFLSESKHRPRSETEELLRMTLATGKAETKSDDRILFRAHKNFGGGVQRDYHLRRIDGIWYVVRIDINE